MALQLSDEGVFDISKALYAEFESEKIQKELDVDELDLFKKTYIKPLYPHKKNNEKYSCDDYCCELSPGRFCCCDSSPPGPEYREFGLGVCLYVKFIKHIALFLFFVSILAAFSVAVYEFVSIRTGYSQLTSYPSLLFSTTSGIMSAQYSRCAYGNINSNTASFEMSCESGKINLLSPVFTNETLMNVKNCGREYRKLSGSNLIPSYAITTNTVPSDGTISLSMTLGSSQNEPSGYSYEHLSFVYECTGDWYTLGAISFGSNVLIYVTVGVDLFIVAIFILFMCSENSAEKKEVSTFKERELAVNDFTIVIKGFKMSIFEKQIRSFLEGYNSIISRDSHNETPHIHFVENVVQIKVPQSEEISSALSKRREIYEELYNLIEYCFLDDRIDLFKYKDCEDFIRRCYGSGQAPEYIEYKKELSELVHKFMESRKTKNETEEEKEISIFLTLSNPKHKSAMLKHAKHSCFSTYLKIDGLKYKFSEPPVADMIIWENKNKNTCLRVFFAWVITLGICLCSYLLVGFAKWKEEDLMKNNKFNIDCSLLYSSSQLATWNINLFETSNQQYLHCYCSKNYFSFSTTDSNMRETCSTWIRDYVVFQAIPILISVGIVVYNLIVSRIFRALSRFEGHKYLSQELYSYIIKRSFMLIMNMGLVIILLKLNFKSTFTIDNLSFLFLGIYADITSDWYFEIGVIIILTLAINISVPILDMIIVAFLKCMRKCWDRRFYCRKTSQKTKKGYIELYSGDVFPIEERYSDFISMIVITLSFGAVMPLLYIITFLAVWFTFICDKLLMFRMYQRPPNFTKDLQNNVFKVVYIALMAHCVISAFLFSEPTLGRYGGMNETGSRFKNIMTTPYLIPYAALFLALAAWAVFYSTIVKFCSYCAKKCSKQINQMYKQKLHQNFFKALNLYQINRLKKSLEMQIHSCVEHSKLAEADLTKIICQNTISKLIETERRLNDLRQTNHGEVSETGEANIRLIGKAGYDEIFDDDLFNRDRKIKSIDFQFIDILKQERRKLVTLNTIFNEETITGLNPNET